MSLFEITRNIMNILNILSKYRDNTIEPHLRRLTLDTMFKQISLTSQPAVYSRTMCPPIGRLYAVKRN